MLSPAPLVCCRICTEIWDATDPGVEYRSLDGTWWCRDETACTSRRARAEATAAAAAQWRI